MSIDFALRHAQERFYKAVEYLCTGRETIKERLKFSAGYLDFRQEEVPKDLLKEFKELISELGVDGSEKGISRAIDAMSEEKASELASRILTTYNDLSERKIRRDASRANIVPK